FLELHCPLHGPGRIHTHALLPRVHLISSSPVGHDRTTHLLIRPDNSLAYDMPIETGVCSDVVVRAFRAAGLDLQVLVHEDMKRNFSAYPRNWGLRAPDTNIDHRRVPNLATYFKRRGR